MSDILKKSSVLGVAPQNSTQKSRAVIDMIWVHYYFFNHGKKTFMVMGLCWVFGVVVVGFFC